MKKILFIICLLALYCLSNAQLKVRQDGTVLINGDRPADNAGGEVATIVYGDYGTNLANGRLAIGDYGQMANQGGNVFLGEYGNNTDSDILQLHGKKGFYFTRNDGDIVAHYEYATANAFYFNCQVWANGVQLTSDLRLKTNIKKLNSSLDLIKKIDGISYNLLPRETVKVKFDSSGSPVTEKEIKAQTEYEKAKQKYLTKLANKKRIGFVAQDLQKIFPELVDQDSAGYLAVDYIGLIPVLVEAIKELEARIETIENDCCNNNGKTKSGIINSIDDLNSSNKAKLYQNAPNPFSNSTTIRFEIPETIQSAQLHICNMTGTLLKTIEINQRGNGQEIISGNEFNAGMYLYSLVTDGNIVDTKQMILTN